MRILLAVYLSCLIYVDSFATATSKTGVAQTEKAILSGGCFWCLEADFDKIPGVISTVSGYTGGNVNHPTYDQVSGGGTGHYESVEVTYNPAQVSYKALLMAFMHKIDPADAGGQFCDRGNQYRSAIFYLNDQQKEQALSTIKQLLASGHFKQVATKILPAKPFYRAEEYHQNYYQKNPIRYRFYRSRCGRDQQVDKVWGVRDT